jgi:hypothetical protein
LAQAGEAQLAQGGLELAHGRLGLVGVG